MLTMSPFVALPRIIRIIRGMLARAEEKKCINYKQLLQYNSTAIRKQKNPLARVESVRCEIFARDPSKRFQDLSGKYVNIF